MSNPTTTARVLGVAAAGLAVWFLKGSREAQHNRFEVMHAEHIADHYMKSVEYPLDHPVTKYPIADRILHAYHEFTHNSGAALMYQEVKMNASTFFEDVIMDNAVPITLGIGGIWAAFGDKIGPWVKARKMSPWMKDAIEYTGKMAWKGVGALFKAGGSVLEGGFKLFKAGGAVSFAIVGLLGFLGYRLHQVESGQAARDTFDDIYNMHTAEH